MSIVITSFGLFTDLKENASSSVVQALKELWANNSELAGCNVLLKTYENIPVAYEPVRNIVKEIWEKDDPDLVIHVGVDVKTKCIAVEVQAFNGIYNSPGVDDQYCLPENVCYPGAVGLIKCRLDLQRTVQQLANNEIAVKMSCNPGCFLCGFIYYLSLSQNPDKCVFIHVPEISEKTTASKLASALWGIIQDLAEQRGIPLPKVSLV